MFRRKAYDALTDRKKNYAPHYACLLEGTRRVDKTTLTEEFARNEYTSYIRIDFSDISQAIRPFRQIQSYSFRACCVVDPQHALLPLCMIYFFTFSAYL